MNARERKQVASFMADLSRPWETSAAPAPRGLMDGIAVCGSPRRVRSPLEPWLTARNRGRHAGIGGVVIMQRNTAGMWRAVLLSEHLDPPGRLLGGCVGGPGWFASKFYKTRAPALAFMRKRDVAFV